MWSSLIRKSLICAWNLGGKSILNAKDLEVTKNSDGIETSQLVIIFPYFGAKSKALNKYAQYFLDQQFDVLVLKYSWYDCFWPEAGAQIIAKQVAEFLSTKVEYEKIVVYGFCGGVYFWGEVLEIMSQNASKYNSIGKRIVGQVFDSITPMDPKTLAVKFPQAVFPNSKILRWVLEKCIRYHAITFYGHTSRHYLQSFQQIKDNQMIKSPLLTFASRDDEISYLGSTCDLVCHWRGQGKEVDLKVWDSSPHVQHFKFHQEEYEDTLLQYLMNLNTLPYPSKFRRTLAFDYKRNSNNEFTTY